MWSALCDNTTMAALFVGAALTLVFYLWFKGLLTFTYWSNKGVKTPPTVPILGNLVPLVTRQIAITDYFTELYFKYKKDRVCGVYAVNYPFLVVTDNELMYRMFTTDMPYFESHGLTMDLEKDPLSGSLFNATGAYWKNLRAKLTPTFTSGKLKAMYSVMEQTGTYLQEMVAVPASKGEDIEVVDFLARFATDVIGTVAFGLEINSVNDGDSEFRKMGKAVFEPISFSGMIKQIITMVVPYSSKLLGSHTTKEHITNFFVNVITDLVDYREKNNVSRSDFLDLLLKLKNNKLTDDQGKLIDFGAQSGEFTLNHKELMSQVFVFFLGGFETSSATSSFALYNMALNQDVQDKARKEVQDVLKASGGKYTYDALGEMEYLGNVINETLRTHSTVNILFRQCTTPYFIPDTQIKIDKGTMVLMPIGALHNDPELWDHPEKFDPDRFTPDRKPANLNRIYMPFGQGPRVCIGQRFGLLQTKLGLAKLLSKYRFEPSEQTKIPMEYHKPGSTPNLCPVGGIHLRIRNL